MSGPTFPRIQIQAPDSPLFSREHDHGSKDDLEVLCNSKSFVSHVCKKTAGQINKSYIEILVRHRWFLPRHATVPGGSILVMRGTCSRLFRRIAREQKKNRPVSRIRPPVTDPQVLTGTVFLKNQRRVWVMEGSTDRLAVFKVRDQRVPS